MRNWKVSVKLFAAFMVLVFFALIIGGFGIYGMFTMNYADDSMYQNNVMSLTTVARMQRNFQQIRIYIRDAIIFYGDTAEYARAENGFVDLDKQMRVDFAYFDSLEKVQEELDDFHNFEKMYIEQFCDEAAVIIELGKATSELTGFSDEATRRLDALGAVAESMQINLNNCYDISLHKTEQAVAGNTNLFQTLTIILGAIILAALIFAIVIATVINRSIAFPIANMVDAAQRIAVGDMNIDIQANTTDEVGQLAQAFSVMAQSIKHQTEVITRIAQGDLTISMKKRSENDMVTGAISEMVDNLHHVMHEGASVAGQVASGAGQVANGSQALAQGATEQATAVDQILESMHEISATTRENAEMIERTAELYTGINQRAQESAELMNDLMVAIEEIMKASSDISHIIKLINDVSFQTNILSLNAAVEAANAGHHGRGFAVVAGEVRSLAEQSTQAANDTDALIENSIKKAQLGEEIAKKTYAALNGILEDVRHTSKIIQEIAQRSQEQAVGIDQVNHRIDQVAKVVNMNSATADQSAMAAEEMASQATAMQRIVSKFNLREEIAKPVPIMKSRAQKPENTPPVAVTPPVDMSLPLMPPKRNLNRPVIILEEPDDGSDKY